MKKTGVNLANSQELTLYYPWQLSVQTVVVKTRQLNSAGLEVNLGIRDS